MAAFVGFSAPGPAPPLHPAVPAIPAAARSMPGAGPASHGLGCSLAAAGLVAAAAAAGRAGRHRRRAQLRSETEQRRSIKLGGADRSEKELDRYRVSFSAEDAGDWTAGRILSVEEGPSNMLLKLEIEASREYVALKRAYRAPGQRAQIRLNGQEMVLPVASPPVSLAALKDQLWRLKGDLYAGQTKKEVQTESYRLVVDVLAPLGTAATAGMELEAGPFTDEAVDLRQVLARFQAPALAFLCDGSPEAVCALRATLEAENCASELQVRSRSCGLLFCGPAAVPPSLQAWLEGARAKHRLAVCELAVDPAQAWDLSGRRALQELEGLGMKLGAVVLGRPEFLENMTLKLRADGVSLLATSSSVLPLARVVDTEQI